MPLKEITDRLDEIFGLTEATTQKVVVVYSGRFQPAHRGHYETFTNVLKEFPHADVFIGTSDKVDLPKSPFNFKEKKQIISKMFGVKSNQIKQIKNPYGPKEILEKYPEDTVYITVVGKKDAERLGKGKYFDFYAKGDEEMEGYPEKGYIFIAPENNTLYKGVPLSGTVVRDTFSNADEAEKEELFKTLYGKLDKKIFKLITSKIKLDESLNEATKLGFSKDQQKTIATYLKKLGYKSIETFNDSVLADYEDFGETKSINIERGRRDAYSDKRKNGQDNLTFVIRGENEDYPVENRWGQKVDDLDAQIKEMLELIKGSM